MRTYLVVLAWAALAVSCSGGTSSAPAAPLPTTAASEPAGVPVQSPELVPSSQRSTTDDEVAVLTTVAGLPSVTTVDQREPDHLDEPFGGPGLNRSPPCQDESGQAPSDSRSALCVAEWVTFQIVIAGGGDGVSPEAFMTEALTATSGNSTGLVAQTRDLDHPVMVDSWVTPATMTASRSEAVVIFERVRASGEFEFLHLDLVLIFLLDRWLVAAIELSAA